MTELRPIGTIFSIDNPPSLLTTDARSRVVTYKVIAHMKVAFTPEAVNGLAEEISPIKIEYSDGEVIE